MEEVMEAKTYPVTHTDEEWKKLLTPDQFYVLRRHGTEAPGSCALNYEKRHGAFKCAGCGQTLFVSKRKFDSGTGWPSFNDPEPGAIETSDDKSLPQSELAALATEAHEKICPYSHATRGNVDVAIEVNGA